MARYVDLDKVVNQLDKHYTTLGKKYGFDDMYVRGYGEAISNIEDEPEIIERGIFRGHWIGKPISGYADCKCSVCGAVCNIHASAGIPTQRYCYKCGALMLEETNDERN